MRRHQVCCVAAPPPQFVDIVDMKKNVTFDHTLRAISRSRTHNSCACSGESGAGKTESTKFILQYLANLNSKHSLVEEQILMANPILEAFGNAKTARNNNSSRFGKFVRVLFGAAGAIQGATISDYLLEKSRIIYQAANERNYHMFYNVLVGMTPDQKTALYLDKPSAYRYLGFGDGGGLQGRDDKEEYRTLLEALELLNFAKPRIDDIFRLVATVLQLGNVDFSTTDQEGRAFSAVCNADGEL